MTIKGFSVALVAILFLLSSLACSRLLPTRSADTPERQVVISQEAAQEAAQIVVEASQGSSVRMNEAQFTSLIASQLAQSGEEVPLRDITVWFEPGQIVMQGQLDEGVIPLLSGQMVMSGQLAAENNAVVFNIQNATIGGVKLPGAAVNILNDRVNTALSRSDLGERVRSITINQGEIIIEQD